MTTREEKTSLGPYSITPHPGNQNIQALLTIFPRESFIVFTSQESRCIRTRRLSLHPCSPVHFAERSYDVQGASVYGENRETGEIEDLGRKRTSHTTAIEVKKR